MHERNDLLAKAGLLLLLSKIVYPDLPAHTYPVYMLLKYIKLAKRKLRFAFEVIPSEIIRALSSGVDDDCVLVNAGYHRAILDSSEYIALNCNGKTRVVRALSADVPEGRLYIGDTLKHNLNVCNASKLRPIDAELADEVEVALITTQHNLSDGATDALLRSYFERPQPVYVGDTLCVSVEKHAPEVHYTNLTANVVEYVHFRCTKVKGPGPLCVVGATTLKRTADVCGLVAARPRFAVDVVKGVEDWVEACPGGLGGHLERLERAVRPFLGKRKPKLNPIFLVRGARGSGKRSIVSSLSRRSGLKLCRLSNAELSAQAYAQNEIKIRNAFFRAKLCAPCIVAIDSFENLCKNNEGQHDQRIVANFKSELDTLFADNEHPVIVVCLSNTKELPSELGRLFLETFIVEAPNQKERLEMLQWIMKKRCITHGVNLTEVAGKTHGFVFEDLEALVFRAEAKAVFDGSRRFVTLEDFETALDAMQSTYTESLGAPKVPKVLWSDVGGLEDVKQEIVRTINLPLKHPELLKNGLKRSGILLYGPPGTGKTLLAKAVATECALCFLSVKGPELLNMYVGQSEQNVREVFERARSASPCVIFFDELDSLAPNRGVSGDSGGVMDRVVSQLLAEMDGLNEKATVFVIGATNRPDLVDPALLRPGRFDRLLYVGPCTDYASKLGVLKALTRKFHLSDKLSLEKVVKSCPENITGADFYGICSNAWLSAAGRLIRKIEKGKADKDETKVVVTMKDFEDSIKSTKPSVSAEDLRYFERLKRELGAKK